MNVHLELASAAALCLEGRPSEAADRLDAVAAHLAGLAVGLRARAGAEEGYRSEGGLGDRVTIEVVRGNATGGGK